jgi:1-acyl-sn-glycerol-3-phosphate acyltransferase
MSHLRAGLLFCVIMAMSLIVIPPQWLFTKVWPAAARQFPHWYFRIVAKLMGIRLDIRGKPVSGKPCLYVANHLSWLDIVVLSAVKPMSFIAKKEVAGWPLFGILATVGRTIYIDRERRHDVRYSGAAIRKRFEKGEIVTLFPEGTSSDGNRLLPFRSALMGTAEMQVNDEPVFVQPVTIAYTGVHGIPLGRVRRPIFAWHGKMQLLPHLLGVGRIGPFEVTLTFHQPTTVRASGSRKELARHCESLIRASVIEALTGRRPVTVPKFAENR